jgi:hypothetical protein
MRPLVLSTAMLAIAAASADARPFTPFDVIAPGTMEIAYDPDYCSLPDCQLLGVFQVGLVAATTASLNVAPLRAFLTAESSPSGFIRVATFGDPWVNGTLLPGQVSSVYPTPDPAFSVELLPGEVILPPLGSPGSLLGSGVRGELAFTDSFFGQVPLDVTVRLHPGQDSAVARFTILTTFSPTGHPPLGYVTTQTITSTQRVSAVPVPEAATTSLLGIGLAAMTRARFARRRK